MTLDLILKPFKTVDKEILRQYTKLTKKWEDKGRSKYELSSLFNIGAKGFLMPSYCVSIFTENHIKFGIAFGSSLENTFEAFCFNPSASRSEYLESNCNVKSSFVEKMKSFYNFVRLPVFAGGISQVGTGIINLYNYFSGEDSSVLPTAINEILFGAGFLSWASAMYVRDSDPKLLDKKPLWKTAYEKVRDKVKDLAPKPSPVPVPVPVQNYSGLENYVENSNLNI